MRSCRRSPRVVLLATLALTVAACSGADATAGSDVTVLAAASLTDAFTELGETFEASHEGASVRFSFAGSQQLATQVVEGAPADVFASANTAQMDVVVAAGAAADDPVAFTGNRLAIAVEPGNPLGITELEDLADPGLTLVLAAEEVPAGRYAQELLDAADVDVRPDSYETDVRAVLSKVALGEADAGIVYVSDVVAAGDDVHQVAIPDDRNVTATYPLVVLADAPAPDLAQAFVDLVLSEEGQAVLAAHGFAPAP